jgi:RND family efflux transporter MFP subunit
MKKGACWIWVACFCLLGSGCGPSGNDETVEFRVPVTVAEISSGDVEDLINATGTLRASQIVSLTVESRGVLNIARSRGRRLAEGDRVTAGEVIAEISGEDVRVAARTEATRRRFESAKSDFEATRKLFDEGLINETELRRAETTLEDARLEYDRSLLVEVRNKLVTPIDGIILSLARDVNGRPMADGQLVAPGFVVAQIAPTAHLVADIDIVGADVARIAEGLPVRVLHHAFGGREFPGRVERLAPAINELTRALRAEVGVDNSEGLLRPGMFVEARVLIERREGVVVVPREAVSERAGKRVVFVLQGRRVVRREVELGLGDDQMVEVMSGVELGERVVVRGLETLTDGSRVRVTGGQ